jgi:hypothetical protein
LNQEQKQRVRFSNSAGTHFSTSPRRRLLSVLAVPGLQQHVHLLIREGQIGCRSHRRAAVPLRPLALAPLRDAMVIVR